MAKLVKKKRVSYYDWYELTKAFKELTGKDYRNWAGKTYKEGETLPYQDFWHYMCDLNPEINNGSLSRWCFQDIVDNEDAEPWQKEVANGLVQLVGKHEVEIKFDW